MSRQGWGPTIRGGRPRKAIRVTALVVAWLSLLAAGGVISVAALTVKTVQDNITQVEVPALEQRTAGGPLNLLVVGSDSREGLTREQRLALTLGADGSAFGGQRSDTVLLVSILPDHRGVNVVSFPRDLPVINDGRRIKLTESFFDGPENLVEVVQENFGIPIHHYVEVSVLGFLGTVEALGSVRICLDERLFDNKSGANFDAGCHDLTPEQALAYVRSRRGSRGDFERIERQQNFLKATLRELVDTQLLVDVPRLLKVVEEVASNVTTDDGLGIGDMQRLAEDLRAFASGDVPMTFVPSYVQNIGGKSFVVPYAPGAYALFDAIERGDLLAPRGTPEQRQEVEVSVWSGGRALATDLCTSTLFWSGFRPDLAGRGPIDAGETTTVFYLAGFEVQGRMVAATLGAPLQPFPVELEAPTDAQVVVVVGDDAAGGLSS